ncbi:MAG: hypothetical protein JO187_13190, partial [Acidobacteria bacterium]|nr:hypothetical protein [Acidobacteriota bacterium]
MKAKRLLFILLMFAVAGVPTLLAQREPAPSAAAAEGPVLTMEDAVSLALRNNRLVKISALEAQKFDFRVSTMRTRRLPQFQFAALGGELVHSFDFSFDQGVFGTYPNIGPVPGRNT